MENRGFAVIVKVHDLDRCRNFYRDLLGLGDPVLDSSFTTVFSVPGGGALMLQVSAAAYLEHENSATSWIFGPTDIAATVKRLRGAGIEIELRKNDGWTREVYRGADPEGNPFYLQPAPGKDAEP